MTDARDSTLDGIVVGEGSHAQLSLKAARAQLGAAHAERDALAESLRLSQREVVALQRTAEADEAHSLALVARVEAAEERANASEQRRSAFQALAEAQGDELERQNENLRRMQGSMGNAKRLQATLEAGAQAQAERFQLARRGEAALKEELMRAAAEGEALRADAHRTHNLMRTQEALISRLEERLEAQADLARLQLGLPAQPVEVTSKETASTEGGDEEASGARMPRVIRLRLAGDTDGGFLPAVADAEPGHLAWVPDSAPSTKGLLVSGAARTSQVGNRLAATDHDLRPALNLSSQPRTSALEVSKYSTASSEDKLYSPTAIATTSAMPMSRESATRPTGAASGYEAAVAAADAAVLALERG